MLIPYILDNFLSQNKATEKVDMVLFDVGRLTQSICRRVQTLL